jgi:hypothetical protein
VLLIVSSSVDILTKNLIARSLAAVCDMEKQEYVIVDLNFAGSELFWQNYCDNIKHVESCINILAGLNGKAVRDYVLSSSINAVLVLQRSNLFNISFEKFLCLLNILHSEVKNVFIIFPEHNLNFLEPILQKISLILVPYFSDSLSFKNAFEFSGSIKSLKQDANILPIQLFSGLEFNSKITERNIFSPKFSLTFDLKIREQILSSKFVWKDDRFVKAI